MSSRIQVVSAAALVVLALVLAGCGESSDSGESNDSYDNAPQRPSGAPQGAPDMSGIEDFRNCLKKQGVKLPEGGQGGPQGFDPSSIDKAAIEACSKYMPMGGPPGGGPPGGVPPGNGQ